MLFSCLFLRYAIWDFGKDNQRCEEFKLTIQLHNSKKIIGTSNYILREIPVMLMTEFS